jgi:hypothetical protein
MLKRHPAAVRRSGFFTAIAIAVVAAAFVSPAAQAASCASRTLTSPFSRFGDTNQYFLAPSGSFESGASGWALSNAATALGNDSYFLHSTSDKSSLKLTGSALSPGFCITRDDPLLRFTAKTVTTAGSNGNYSQLNVSIIVKNAAGSQGSYFLGAVQPQGNSGWFVLPQMHYGALFDSYLFGSDGLGTATMQLQFTVAGQGGTWYVDDIYVDPFSGK